MVHPPLTHSPTPSPLSPSLPHSLTRYFSLPLSIYLYLLTNHWYAFLSETTDDSLFTHQWVFLSEEFGESSVVTKFWSVSDMEAARQTFLTLGSAHLLILWPAAPYLVALYVLTKFFLIYSQPWCPQSSVMFPYQALLSIFSTTYLQTHPTTQCHGHSLSPLLDFSSMLH